MKGDIEDMHATPADKLKAVKAAMRQAGYKSVAKPVKPQGEWFRAPTSTENVDHLISIGLDTGAAWEIEILCALRNADIEMFSGYCLYEFGRTLEERKDPARWPYARILGLAGGPRAGPLRIKLFNVPLHPDMSQDHLLSEIMRIQSGNLAPGENITPEQIAEQVLTILSEKFEPEFAKVRTAQQHFDCLVADEGIWQWWMSSGAVRIAQIFALGARIGVTKVKLLELVSNRLEQLRASLPKTISTEVYLNKVLEASDRFRLN